MDPGWVCLNEILAHARMKSALQMKLNPPFRRRAGFHPRRGFHRRRRFIPPGRVDLVEKDSDRYTIRVFFWQRMRDSNPRKRSQSPVCYRYTNPLCVKHGYYYIRGVKKVKHFFPIFKSFYCTETAFPKVEVLFITYSRTSCVFGNNMPCGIEKNRALCYDNKKEHHRKARA